MYSISKFLRRSQSYKLAPSSFGAVSKLEITVADKESAFASSGLTFSNKSQGLFRRYSVRYVISRFIGINKLSSIADATDKGVEEEKEEEAFPVYGDVAEEVENDSVFDSELGSDVDACGDGPMVLKWKWSIQKSGKQKRKELAVSCLNPLLHVNQ